jgi:hypothetical protein
MLRVHSQRTNTKLMTVAERVIETGSLDEASPTAGG